MSYQSTWDAHQHDILAAAHRIKALYPDAWEEVKVPGQKSRRFISLVAAECQRLISPDIGCNLKRGGPDVSLDVLAMPNPSGARDATGTYPGLELRDIIADAEGGPLGKLPSIVWGDATQKTIDAGVPGGWIKTAALPPLIQLPPVPVFPYPDEGTLVKAFQDRVKAAYKAVERIFPDPNDSDAYRHFARYGYDCRGMEAQAAADKRIKELRQQLGAPAE